MTETKPKSGLDVLGHIENVTEQLDKSVAKKGKSVFSRYPLTFSLLALFGAVLLSEGVRGILQNWGLLEKNPSALIFIGFLLLIFTGTLYKRLGQK